MSRLIIRYVNDTTRIIECDGTIQVKLEYKTLVILTYPNGGFNKTYLIPVGLIDNYEWSN